MVVADSETRNIINVLEVLKKLNLFSGYIYSQCISKHFLYS